MTLRKTELVEKVHTIIECLENDYVGDDTEALIMKDIERKIEDKAEGKSIMNDISDVLVIVKNEFFIEGFKAGIRASKVFNIED